MSVTEVKQSIIDKIQKLLALSKGTSSLNEQAVAFAAAQKLMSTHQLSIAVLEAAGTSEKEKIEKHTPLYRGKRVVNWKCQLAFSLCKLNGCSMFIDYYPLSEGGGLGFAIVGRVSDAQVVQYFFDSIIAQIEMLCREAMNAGDGAGKTFSNGFKTGATQTVISRLTQAQEDVHKEHQDSTAMVWVDQKAAEVKQWISNNIALTSSNRPQVNLSTDAVSKGKEAGYKINLAKGLSSTTNSTKQLNT